MTKTNEQFADLIGEERGQGRPTKYEGAKTDDLANSLALLGFKNDEIAEALGIHVDTLQEWMKIYPSFSESVNSGKVPADGKVARAFYSRATGTMKKVGVVDDDGNPVIDEITGKQKIEIIHVNPDAGAALNWLKNRQSKLWKDTSKVEHTGADGKDLIPEQDSADVARRLAFLLTQSVQEKQP